MDDDEGKRGEFTYVACAEGTLRITERMKEVTNLVHLSPFTMR